MIQEEGGGTLWCQIYIMSLTAAVHQVSRVVLVVKVTGFEIETIAAEWTTTKLSVEEQLRRKNGS